MSADLAIETRALRKRYGRVDVLHGIDLKVPTGSTYGLIGANGAGKTTTIRILLGLIAATSGTARVLDLERGTLPPRPSPDIAYLPDVPDLDPWMRPDDALVYLARLCGTAPDLARQRAADLLDAVGLSRARGRIGGFSRGMKQRLGIAAALVAAPRLLILDEPTSALDPLGRADVLALIRALRGQATIVFTSHLLGDVQDVCDRVGMLSEGRLLLEGPTAELLAAHRGRRATITVTADAADADRLRRRIDALLIDEGVDARLDVETSTLHSIYEDLTRGGRDD
ncbi:ABC transporter ATP-binding protein [Actinomyces sp. B33]|uniref:ABC transporter ATP-binding protein n=1 Tax=Actinomyces sp. B33 TaxID=2942131 RepID=UPI002340429D|nr:ABC transporter ATP-binding protein [Actinomyces sp. B33]MDC4232795.1 ABC transporter ATP-binding protein [Actinomyces sp. B33]